MKVFKTAQVCHRCAAGLKHYFVQVTEFVILMDCATATWVGKAAAAAFLRAIASTTARATESALV